jgi:hypothetical protein
MHNLDNLPQNFLDAALATIAALEGLGYTVADVRRSRLSHSTYLLFTPPGGRFKALTGAEKRAYLATRGSLPSVLARSFNVRVNDHAGHGDGTEVHASISVKRDPAELIGIAATRAAILAGVAA